MEKIKLLLYCNKLKPYLFSHFKTKFFTNKKEIYANSKALSLNGKIIAECDFEVEEIKCEEKYGVYYTNNINAYDLINKSYLSAEQLDEYLKGKNGYAIHIKNLNIFDEPRYLMHYQHRTKGIYIGKDIYKAPQNMMYCYDRNTDEEYILISIRPEWLCKILNGEKTIEVRKKVLKEMVRK